MRFIAHRRNALADLAATPAECGIEVDIRSQGNELIVQHDPFQPGDRFDEWISHFRHGTLILNVKEEGLESRLLDCMSRHSIEDFFFLDQSFPFLLKTALAGEQRCAVRVSEMESIDTALSLAGKVSWAWVDCFTRFPLDREQWQALKVAGYRLCIVSPELLGREPVAEILGLRSMFASWGVQPDAVCSKLRMLDAWTLPI